MSGTKGMTHYSLEIKLLAIGVHEEDVSPILKWLLASGCGKLAGSIFGSVNIDTKARQA